MKKIVSLLMLAALLCTLCITAYADETGSVWTTVTSDETATTVHIVTDTTVTDGKITVTYDAEKLTYTGIESDEHYVSTTAVNSGEAGKLIIAWVAPEAFAADGTGKILIKVNFTGTADADSFGTEGTFHTAGGAEVPLIKDIDTTELEAALAAAAEIKTEDYTDESVKALTDAVAAGEAVLEDPAASQSEVDAAAKAIRDAIDALEAKVDTSALEEAIEKAEKIDKDKYTEETVKALEEALKEAKEALADPELTQKGADDAAKKLTDAINGLKQIPTDGPPTGDTTPVTLLIIVACVCAAGIVALVFVKRRFTK